MRKVNFVNNEYYHIYNRGVDKREIFSDYYDLKRFFQSMEEFNSIEPIGSIYENSFNKKHKLGHPMSKSGELVNFICYCLNPNHYHFMLEQLVDNGIEKFMQRIGNGYTKFFNNKYKRSGSLLQGKYKSIHIDSNEYLLHLSVYINLNDKVHKIHQLGHPMSKSMSSWGEYVTKTNLNKKFCVTDIILDQFKNSSEYENFSSDSLSFILENKEMEDLLLE